MTVSTPKSVLRDVYTVASRDRRSSMLDMGNEGVVNYAPDGSVSRFVHLTAECARMLRSRKENTSAEGS